MNFKDLAKKVDELNESNGGEWTASWQLAWIIEELGEVSRELIKLRKLPGRFNPDKTLSGLKEELGDVMYGIVSLANNHQIDLTEALEFTINKFAARQKNRSG